MQIYIIKRKQTDQSQIIFTKANTVKKKKKGKITLYVISVRKRLPIQD